MVAVCSGEGVYHYRVSMAPGYQCGELLIYPAPGQHLLRGNALSQPPGWTAGSCPNGQVSWAVPAAAATDSAGVFTARFDRCLSGQVLALRVYPILTRHPYIPNGVPGPTFSFYAKAGECAATPTPGLTWGEVRRMYR